MPPIVLVKTPCSQQRDCVVVTHRHGVSLLPWLTTVLGTQGPSGRGRKGTR